MNEKQDRPLSVAAALAVDRERHVAFLDSVVGALDRRRETNGVKTAIRHQTLPVFRGP
jgi:hypothetical protein